MMNTFTVCMTKIKGKILLEEGSVVLHDFSYTSDSNEAIGALGDKINFDSLSNAYASITNSEELKSKVNDYSQTLMSNDVNSAIVVLTKIGDVDLNPLYEYHYGDSNENEKMVSQILGVSLDEVESATDDFFSNQLVSVQYLIEN